MEHKIKVQFFIKLKVKKCQMAYIGTLSYRENAKYIHFRHRIKKIPCPKHRTLNHIKQYFKSRKEMTTNSTLQTILEGIFNIEVKYKQTKVIIGQNKLCKEAIEIKIRFSCLRDYMHESYIWANQVGINLEVPLLISNFLVIDSVVHDIREEK